MNRNGKRIIFYFGIAVILSGIATILSSPVFFEKRVFEITVNVTFEPTTEHSFLEPTTDETTTLAAARTTETTEINEITSTTESHSIEYTTGDKIGVTVTEEQTTVTTLAVKDESLPFCLEEPKSTVDFSKYRALY